MTPQTQGRRKILLTWSCILWTFLYLQDKGRLKLFWFRPFQQPSIHGSKTHGNLQLQICWHNNPALAMNKAKKRQLKKDRYESCSKPKHTWGDSAQIFKATTKDTHWIEHHINSFIILLLRQLAQNHESRKSECRRILPWIQVFESGRLTWQVTPITTLLNIKCYNKGLRYLILPWIRIEKA